MRIKKYRSRKPTNLIDFGIDVQDASRPYDDKSVSNKSGILFKKTLSELPKTGSSITVKAEPYDIVLPGSDPYSLVNRANPRAGGAYGGKENLDGGLTQQILTSAVSNFLHEFDSFMLRCRVNYRFLPIDPSDTKRGKGYVREMLQSIDEVLSLAKSTTFTNLAILNYGIYTDLPINGESNYNLRRMCGTVEGMYALLITYQTYLQAIASPFNAYNKFRANQGNMMKSSWNRETPRLNSFFSLMNKSSMVNHWKSLALVLNGEYFDQEWMRQFNMISSLASRASDSMTDPILEMICTHNLPKFRLVVVNPTNPELETDVLSSDELDAIVHSCPNESINTRSFSEMIDYVAKRLSINDILYWVRNTNAYVSTTDQSRFSEINDAITVLTTVSGIFKPAMGDVRTLLDVISRTGVNKWTKSTKLEVFNNINSPLTNNLTVNDLMRAIMSGSDVCTWDESTFRWKATTQWDYYKGIPEYDAKSGGAFLTFSSKKLEVPEGLDNFADYLPILISGFLTEKVGNQRESYMYAINRLGTSINLKRTEFKAEENRNTARLVPIEGLSFTIRAPYATGVTSTIDKSFLQAACLKVFGIYINDGVSDVVEDTSIVVDPDLLCFTTVEIDDLTNEMITYARTKGPFIVNLTDKSSIGFLGLDSNS